MGIRKDEMIQVTTFYKETIEKIQATVAEAQKKQTLTYKIKNFFKNILKFKKQLLTLQKMTEELTVQVTSKINLNNYKDM